MLMMGRNHREICQADDTGELRSASRFCRLLWPEHGRRVR